MKKRFLWDCIPMMVTSGPVITSYHGNAFPITGPWWGESTSHRWIPLTYGQWFGALKCASMFAWNKLLNKQRRCRFVTLMWRHSNASWWQNPRATESGIKWLRNIWPKVIRVYCTISTGNVLVYWHCCIKQHNDNGRIVKGHGGKWWWCGKEIKRR